MSDSTDVVEVLAVAESALLVSDTLARLPAWRECAKGFAEEAIAMIEHAATLDPRSTSPGWRKIKATMDRIEERSRVAGWK